MSSHIIVTVLICAATCHPMDVRVWDGDTIRLGRNSSTEKVRLAGIDAPEIDGACAYETELAQRAKRRLAELLEGRRIILVRRGTDRYGRTLAILTIDGQDVGQALVREGLARVWAGRREPWC